MIERLPINLLNRINPTWIWKHYSKNCQKWFDKSVFILSFDCDTEQDIQVVWDVHSQLMDMGIRPVYAVPGALLKQGESVYQQIVETGAEFINHGGRSHTYFDEKKQRYASCFFYDQQSKEVLRQDVIEGHEILQDVLGYSPVGFRTPHFGTFQSTEQLSFLYEILKGFNYQFSSSTMPYKAFTKGPLYQQAGIWEIPVTGVFSEPFNIMDTWAYFSAPDRLKESKHYYEDCLSLSNFMEQHPTVINIYGDPSHIHDQAKFFEGMKLLLKVSNCITYKELLEKASEPAGIISQPIF